MSTDTDGAAIAAHKKRLIAQGQLYRIGIVHARANVGQALRPEALLEGALGMALGFAGARVETLLAPGGFRLQAVVPYVLTALSFIGRRKLVKPALVVGAVVGVAATWLLRRKRPPVDSL
ncbi:MAG TPA: hypothetical protein DCW29_23495 [Janthinobacterium sp.]|nr:hypothetical protein [Janthinobacterium sp.]